MTLRFLFCAVAGLAVAGSSQAGVFQVHQNGRIAQDWADDPNWEDDDTHDGVSFEMVVFDEAQCFVLGANENVDGGGSLGPGDGRMTCSLMVAHGDRHDFPLGNTTNVEFEDLVLATVTSKLGLESWDGICPKPGVTYPSNMTHRGYELGDPAPVVDQFEVTTAPHNNIVGDHVRVITDCTRPMAAHWTGDISAPDLILTQSEHSVGGDVCDGGTCYVATGTFTDPDLLLTYEVSGVTHTIAGQLSDDGNELDAVLLVGTQETAFTWTQ